MATHPVHYDDPDAQMLFAWVNAKLKRDGQEKIACIATGFEDGVNLAKLIHAAKGKTVPKIAKNPKILAMKLDNITKCLQTLEELGVPIRDISPANINDGDEKLIFGLLYKMMTEFDPQNGQEMYQWVQQQVASQLPGMTIQLDSFSDGRVFAALVNCIAEGSIDISTMNPANKAENLTLAFDTIHRVMEIDIGLSVEHVANAPDEVRLLSFLGLIKTEFTPSLKRVASLRESQSLEEPAPVAAPGGKVAPVAAPLGNTTNTQPARTPPPAPRPPPTFDGIEVQVQEAKNLKNMETFGRMSPYAVVWVNMQPNEKKTGVHRRGGVTPSWNETLTWQGRGVIDKLRMKLIIWDKEPFGFDDYVGAADVGVHTMKKGESVEKWVPITQHTKPAGSVRVRITLK